MAIQCEKVSKSVGMCVGINRCKRLLDSFRYPPSLSYLFLNILESTSKRFRKKRWSYLYATTKGTTMKFYSIQSVQYSTALSAVS